jgi:ankyrin repeat protein
LDELPVTLDETYERALKGIDKEKKDYANRLFHCLVVSIRPLRVEELAELFAILPKADSTPEFNIGWRPEDPEEFILSTCTTLVSVVNIDGEKVIQFSHFSVREYLTSNRIANAEHISHFHILPKSAHTLLARACLGVLFQLDCSVDEAKIQNFPLAPYAAKYWIDHARYEDVASDIQNQMDCLFDKNKPYFSVWIWLHDVDDSWIQYDCSPHPAHPDQVPLYYAALCGFYDLSERLLDAHPGDVNARGGYYETPLQGALYKGYLDIVLLLLERGADPESRDHNSQTALYMASSHGYSEVVRALIDHGADLNAECDDGNEYFAEVGRTPLHAAINRDHPEIALLLLERGANTEIRNSRDQTALYMASYRGFAEVVRFLIDRGANVDAKYDGWEEFGYVMWTPLHAALCKHHPDIALFLLEHGANTETRSSQDQTALYISSSRGFVELVRLLIDRGADVNAICHDCDEEHNMRWTPLHVASYHGRPETCIIGTIVAGVHFTLHCSTR